MAYRVYRAGSCRYCGKDLGVVEQNGGRDRQYCSPAHRQAACRRRRKEKRDGGVSRNEIETAEQIKLHVMACGCGRTIWTVYGNTTIGRIQCTLCNTDFVGR